MYVASPYAPAVAPPGARTPQIRAAEEYAAQLMAAMPGASAAVVGDAFSPSIEMTYPGGRTDTIPYSAIVKGAADPAHPQVRPWRQDPNVVQGSFPGPVAAFTPLMPADFPGMTLLLPLGPGLGGGRWRCPGRVPAGTSLGADFSFVQGLFAAAPGAGPVAPPAAAPPGAPPIPDIATIRTQATDAYNQLVRPYIKATVDIIPGGVWQATGTDRGGYTTEAAVAYWTRFRVTYAARVDYLYRVLQERGVTEIKTAPNEDRGTFFLRLAQAVADPEMVAAVNAWAAVILGGAASATPLDPNAGWFGTVTRWAGYAAAGGVLLLIFAGLAVVLPRD